MCSAGDFKKFLVFVVWICFLVAPRSCEVEEIYFSGVLPNNSNCTHAFGNSTQRLLDNSGKISSVFGFTELADRTLEVINIGFGTTATHAIYAFDSEHHAPSCHWVDCEPAAFFPSKYSNFIRHFHALQRCMIWRKPVASCSTDYWISKLKELLLQIVKSGLKSMGDTPTYFLLGDLVDLIPDIHVQHSVRDPINWTLRRVATHETAELMCDIRDERNRNVSNPFHIMECITGSEYVHDRLIPMKDYMQIDKVAAHGFLHGQEIPADTMRLVQDIARFYVDFNQRARNTVPSLSRYWPLCMWDDSPSFGPP